jgi:hypothetical protein
MDMPTRKRATPGQLALAHSLSEQRGDAAGQITHVHASVYTDPRRFEAEQAALFTQLPR